MEIPQFLHPWLAVAVTLLIFVALQVRRGVPTDLLFVSGLVVLALTGVVTPQQALSGFSNPAMLTVAGLLMVAAGLRSAGVLDWVGSRLLGTAHSAHGALLRLAPVLVASSAFLLNTALVAMMMPVVVDWCRRRQVSPSKLLIPLSYLTILGGVCTLIGTSTTLVVNGILRDTQQQRLAEAQELAAGGESSAEQAARAAAFALDVAPMSLFELGAVGLPCALAGATFLLVFGYRLLPDRTDIVEQLGEQRREYLVEMLVQPECPLIGSTVERAGLRQLPGLFLIEIDREGDILTPVTPHDVIHSGDRLVFTGVVSTIVDLEKIPGLVPAADMTYEFHPRHRQQRHLTEVVLSRTSPLIGNTVRDGNFRQLYNAAVVAVHRNGVRLTNKIGNIRLEPGDTLLLQTRDEFVSNFRNSRDFYLVSPVEGTAPRRHDKLWLAAALAGGLILWLVASSCWEQTLGGWASPAIAALAVAVLMVATRCVRVADARQALDLQTLVTIAAALGLGVALTQSGAARAIATSLVAQVGDRPYLLLIVIYLLGMAFTEMITNNAVAAMLIPFAIEVAWEGGYNPRPFIMAIALSASLPFMTPIGYQSNLMVMGPGGYRPLDYVRCGLPLAMVVTATSLVLIPWVWPF
ncbi:MAG: SLC13 family permease [Pirellulaceae bacterium]|nr:SLC13 family permease [Pirellulaceae bacterium]